MKQLKIVMNCMENIIKKNFFNLKKTDKNQSCKDVFKLNTGNENEEYLNNYQSTTRWQTV